MRGATHAHEWSALVDWSKLPDLGAVALLTLAFASVARHARASVSSIWLTGWLLIAVHFAAFMFLGAPGYWADLATFIGLASLVSARRSVYVGGCPASHRTAL